MRRFHVAAFLPAIFLCSCAPHIVYQHLTDKELVEQSPIIVVGRIEKKEMFWKKLVRQGSESGHPLFWFPVKVRVDVENVVRGDLRARLVEYTYWLPRGSTVGEWNSLQEGGRYVHFLRREGSQLRSVVDFWLSAIRVTTGRHRLLNATHGLPQTIAELLLSPGEDFSVDRFQLSNGAVHATRLIGGAATCPLLEALAGNSDARIRAEACEELRAWSFASSRCSE
jgi:hypothetical protein